VAEDGSLGESLKMSASHKGETRLRTLSVDIPSENALVGANANEKQRGDVVAYQDATIYDVARTPLYAHSTSLSHPGALVTEAKGTNKNTKTSSPSPNSNSNNSSFRERHLRAAKLARFFGVGYKDLRLSGALNDASDFPPIPTEQAVMGGTRPSDCLFPPLNVSVTVQTDVRWESSEKTEESMSLKVGPKLLSAFGGDTGKMGAGETPGIRDARETSGVRDMYERLREMRTAV
jgi:hypothetical protein